VSTRGALALTIIAACSAALLTRERTGRLDEQTATFRVQVDAIHVDAIVTDARGNPVTDLTADDFEVLEDGRPQTITSFALVDIPIESRPAAAPDDCGRAGCPDKRPGRRTGVCDRAR